MGSHWGGFRVALGSQWGAYQLATNRLWGGSDVALMWLWGGFAPFLHSSFFLLPSPRGGLAQLDPPDSRSLKPRAFLARFIVRAQESPRRRVFPSAVRHPLSSLAAARRPCAVAECPKSFRKVGQASPLPSGSLAREFSSTDQPRGGRRDACPTSWCRERRGKAGRRILFAGSQGPDGVVTSARAGGWAGSPAVLHRRAGVPARQSGQNNMALRILGQRGRTKKTHASKSMAPCSNGRSGCRQKSRS